MELIDVQCGFSGARRGESRIVTADECLEMTGRLKIAGALVRTEPDDLSIDIELSNRLLFDACKAAPSLVPCPVVVPDTAGDLPSAREQVDAHIRAGAGAALIRPSVDHWDLAPWVADGLFEALAARRLPLYCVTRYVSLAQAAEVAGRWPGLPIILAELPYGCQRVLYPLLERFGNLHVSIGAVLANHLGLEDLVRRVGAGRLLFGTGFPRFEPMMALTQFTYAELSEHDRVAIGAGNWRKLWSEVKR
jgi:hypothetical protein